MANFDTSFKNASTMITHFSTDKLFLQAINRAVFNSLIDKKFLVQKLFGIFNKIQLIFQSLFFLMYVTQLADVICFKR